MPRIQLEKTKSGKVIGGDGKPILGGFKREARLEVGEYLVKITQLGAKTTKKGPMLILEGTLEASIPEDAAHAAVLVQGKKIAQTFMGYDYEKMAAQICFAADGLTWDEGVEQTEEEINAQLSSYVVDLDAKVPETTPVAGRVVAAFAWRGDAPTNEDGSPKLGADKKPLPGWLHVKVEPAPEDVAAE
jgi:hypothetical protein